jgi:hypothetical protein
MRAVCSVLFFFTIFVTTPLLADQKGARVDAEVARLAQSREWLALLHYPRGGGQSYVVDEQFFLSPMGRRDPVAELQASMSGLVADRELLCRYPARYQYLLRHGLISAQTLDHCQEYLVWRKKLDVQRVVLVLAASYLNSPSSMYGHSFLRLDPGGERAASPFLSYALNFGAQIPPGENGMLYAYRGIFGGYPGFFSLQPYYEKIQEYTRLENRDMWEYQLTLSQPEIEILLSHSWELNGVRFGYYFFDQNCAYRLLELLEVARSSLDLTTGFERAAMPVDTIRRVVDDSLVDDVGYRASRRSELDALTEELGRKEKRIVRALAEGRLDVDAASLETYSEAMQQQLLMAAYRLLRYRYNKGPREPEIARRSLLLLRSANALGKVALPEPERPARPDQGHATSLFALELGELESRTFANMEWRISYHDAIDSISGYPPGASLEMGQLRLRWQEEEGLKLQQFVPVHIRSLSPRDAFSSPISWQVRGIAERLPGGESPLVTAVHGGAGGTWNVLGGNSYLMPSVRLEHNTEFEHNWQFAPGAVLGQLWQGRNQSAELSLSYFNFLDEGERWRYGFSVNQRLTDNQALRLRLERMTRRGQEYDEVALSWRWYW